MEQSREIKIEEVFSARAVDSAAAAFKGAARILTGILSIAGAMHVCVEAIKDELEELAQDLRE